MFHTIICDAFTLKKITEHKISDINAHVLGKYNLE